MKRRAFTLSELLVVVVIIGVLSAVVLPKFSKVIETRKTTEAEELMSAVRTEQEARCTLSKKYTDQTSKLGSYKAGKNFDYSLGTVGMTASAKSGKYTLEMPSYADGRICCSSGCDSLNKNYPLCSDLVDTSKTPDYVVGNEDCGIEIEDGTETPTEPEGQECVSGTTDTQECHNNCGETGIQKNQCIGGKWQGWGACSVSDKESCGGEEPNPSSKCTDGETKSAGETGDGCADIRVTCKNGEWDYSSLSRVLKDGSECYGGQTKDGMSCVQCKWNKCPANKVEMDGICCLPEQIVKNGKCLYKYRPNRFNTGVLVNCHDIDMAVEENGGYMSEEEFKNSSYYYQYQGDYEAYKKAIHDQYGIWGTGSRGSFGNKPNCSAMNYAHYRGGKLPYITDPGPGSCQAHHAYYNGGKWWEGGTRIKGNNVYGSDQDWCDNNCGSKPSCDTKGIISRNAPNKCDAYHCENGWHCDNTEGTGVALECIRE